MGSSGDAKNVVELGKLMDLLNLYFHAAVWIMEWCQDECRGEKREAVQGFTVHTVDLECMEIDREELLSQLMAGTSDDPFVAGVSSYMYATYEGGVRRAVPGVSVNGTSVIELVFKPYPRYLPDAFYMNVFRNTCKTLGLNYRKLLFRYHESLGEDTLRLVRLFRLYTCEQCVLIHDLKDWYCHACARLRDLGYSESPTVEEPVQPVTTFLAGKQMPRLEMAEFLHLSERTLMRWEACGHTPDGWFWPRSTKVKDKVHSYELNDCWDTVTKIMPIVRDRGLDALVREELLALR